MAARKKAEGKNKAPSNTGDIMVGDFAYWRAQAQAMAPDLANEAEGNPDADWQINELAVAMQETAGMLAAHWNKIQKIASKAEKKAVSFGIAMDLDRTNTPSEVNGKISYAEKYSESVQAKVPDPAQEMLPLAEPEQPPADQSVVE